MFFDDADWRQWPVFQILLELLSLRRMSLRRIDETNAGA